MSKPGDPPYDDPSRDEEHDLATRQRLRRPPLYRVLLHNDDYTTRDFVVMVLMRYFHKDYAEATSIMLHVHNHGLGVAGCYPYDSAATKLHQVEQLAREHQMPLRLSMEPDEDPGDEEE